MNCHGLEENINLRIYTSFFFPCIQGYIVRISGGNDKQGFPMKQGVLSNGRVKLLLKKGHSCFRPRRKGDRRRRSVRGCIVDSNLSVLNLVIVKKGEKDIPGKMVVISTGAPLSLVNKFG